MDRYLQQFLPPIVWELEPEEVWRPAEVVEHLKAGCLIHAEKTQQLLVLSWALGCTYWALGCTYWALFQQPHGGKPASVSKHIQTDMVVKHRPGCWLPLGRSSGSRGPPWW